MLLQATCFFFFDLMVSGLQMCIIFDFFSVFDAYLCIIFFMQESPFSSFINNLSPINPTKATHVSQTFSSLSFTSPPSVFTSPHVSLQKDYKFLRR